MRDGPCRSNRTAGRDFEIARVHALLIMGDREARIRDERPVDVRMTIHPVQRHMNREIEQHLERRGRRKCREPGVRDFFRETDVHVLPERLGDLLLKELSETAMPWIDSAEQLTFIEPETNRVVGLTRPRLPRRLLA